MKQVYNPETPGYSDESSEWAKKIDLAIAPIIKEGYKAGFTVESMVYMVSHSAELIALRLRIKDVLPKKE